MKNTLLTAAILSLLLSGCAYKTRSTATDTTTTAATTYPATSTDVYSSTTTTTTPSTSVSVDEQTSTTPSTDVTTGVTTTDTSTASTSTFGTTVTTDESLTAQATTPTSQPTETEATTTATTTPSTTTSATVATTTTTDISTRITEWNLAPAEIQADLDSGMTIVRTKDVVGAPTGAIDDSMLTSSVEQNLKADSEVASASIEVSAQNGDVSLTGTASDANQVGRAIALALNTEGVNKVSSDVKVSTTGQTASTTDTSTTSSTASTSGQTTPTDTTYAASTPSTTTSQTETTEQTQPVTDTSAQTAATTAATGAASTSSTVASDTTRDTTDTTTATIDTTSRSTSEIAAATTSDVTTRITEWRLSSAEIQADLDRGVTIVRTRDVIVGAPTGATDDNVIETIVKGKLQADQQTANAMIDCDANNGEVTLKGHADNAGAVGRAIALALDTEGVTKVSSDIKVNAKENK